LHTSRGRFLLNLSIVLLLSLFALGCAKRARERNIPPQEESWQRAMSDFHRRRFFRAQQLLKDFVLNYSGSSTVDSAQFFLGRCTYELDDYLTAAEEFKRVVSQYPSSKLVGDAAYWEARSYYAQAPKYQLDQSYTTQALDAFQRFLEEYPAHALSDSGYKYIGLCRDKLSHKEYAAARLYYVMHEYASAVLYCDDLLANYYDTAWAEPTQYLKARCFDALKDWRRALQEYQAYLDKYPSGRHSGWARHAVSILSARPTQRGSSAGTP
jgi:outer membrane protein assembly factor BamD